MFWCSKKGKKLLKKGGLLGSSSSASTVTHTGLQNKTDNLQPLLASSPASPFSSSSSSSSSPSTPNLHPSTSSHPTPTALTPSPAPLSPALAPSPSPLCTASLQVSSTRSDEPPPHLLPFLQPGSTRLSHPPDVFRYALANLFSPISFHARPPPHHVPLTFDLSAAAWRLLSPAPPPSSPAQLVLDFSFSKPFSTTADADAAAPLIDASPDHAQQHHQRRVLIGGLLILLHLDLPLSEHSADTTSDSHLSLSEKTHRLLSALQLSLSLFTPIAAAKPLYPHIALGHRLVLAHEDLSTTFNHLSSNNHHPHSQDHSHANPHQDHSHRDQAQALALIYVPLHFQANECRVALSFSHLLHFQSLNIYPFGTLIDPASPLTPSLREKMFASSKFHSDLLKLAASEKVSQDVRRQSLQLLHDLLLAAPTRALKLLKKLKDTAEQVFTDLLTLNLVDGHHETAVIAAQTCSLLLEAAPSLSTLSPAFFSRTFADLFPRCLTPHAIANLLRLLLHRLPTPSAKTELFHRTLTQLGARLHAQLDTLPSQSLVTPHLRIPLLPPHSALFSPWCLMDTLREALTTLAIRHALPLPPSPTARYQPLQLPLKLFRTPPETPASSGAGGPGEPVLFRWNVGLTSTFNANASTTDTTTLKYIDTQIGTTSQCFVQLPSHTKLSQIHITTTCADQETVGRIVVIGYPEVMHTNGIILFASEYLPIHAHLVIPVAMDHELNAFRYLHFLYLPVQATRTNQILCLKLALHGQTAVSVVPALEQAYATRREEVISQYESQVAKITAQLADLPSSSSTILDDAFLYHLFLPSLNALAQVAALSDATGPPPPPPSAVSDLSRDLFAAECLLGRWLYEIEAAHSQHGAEAWHVSLSAFEELIQPFVLYASVRIARQFFSLVCRLHADHPADLARFFVRFLVNHYQTLTSPDAGARWPTIAIFDVLVATILAADPISLPLALQDALAVEVSKLVESPEESASKAALLAWLLKFLLALLERSAPPHEVEAASIAPIVPSPSRSRRSPVPCAACNVTRILDVRYRCGTCVGVDFCEACGPLPSVNHQDLGHSLLLIFDAHVKPLQNDQPGLTTLTPPLYAPIAQTCLYAATDRCSNHCNSAPTHRCINCPNFLSCTLCLDQLFTKAIHPSHHSFIRLNSHMQTNFPELVTMAITPLCLDPMEQSLSSSTTSSTTTTTTTSSSSSSSISNTIENGQLIALRYVLTHPTTQTSTLLDLILSILTRVMTPTLSAQLATLSFRSLLGQLLRFPDPRIQLQTITLLTDFLTLHPDEEHRLTLAQLIFEELKRQEGGVVTTQLVVLFDSLLLCRPLQTASFVPFLLEQLTRCDTLDPAWTSIYSSIFAFLSLSPSLSLFQTSALTDAILSMLMSNAPLPGYLLDAIIQFFRACLTGTFELADHVLLTLVTLFENNFSLTLMAAANDQSLFFSRLFGLFLSALCHYHTRQFPISFAKILSANFIRRLFIFLASCCEYDSRLQAAPSVFLTEMMSALLILFSDEALKTIILDHLAAFPLAEALIFQKILLWLAHHETLLYSILPHIFKKVHHWLCSSAVAHPLIFDLLNRALTRLLANHASLWLAELLLDLISTDEQSARKFFIEHEGHRFIESLIFPPLHAAALSSPHHMSQAVMAPTLRLLDIRLLPPGLTNLPTAFFTETDSLYSPTPSSMLIHQMTLGALRWCLQLPREFIPTAVTLYFVENWRHQTHFSSLPKRMTLSFSARPFTEGGPCRLFTHPIYHPAPPPTKFGNRVIEISFALAELPLAHLPYLSIQLSDPPTDLVVLSGLHIHGHGLLGQQAATPCAPSHREGAKATFERVPNKFHFILARIWRNCIIFPEVAASYTSRENLSTILTSLLRRDADPPSAASVPSTNVTVTEVGHLLEDCIIHLCKTSTRWAISTIHHLIQPESPHIELLSLLISLPSLSLLDSGLLQLQNQVFLQLVDRIVPLNPVRTLTRSLYYRFQRPTTMLLPEDLQPQSSVINTLVLVSFEMLLAHRQMVPQLADLFKDAKSYALLELLSVYVRISGAALLQHLFTHVFFFEKFNVVYLQNATPADRETLLCTLELLALLAGASEDCAPLFFHDPELLRTISALFAAFWDGSSSASPTFLLQLTRICTHFTQTNGLRSVVGPHLIPIILQLLLQQLNVLEPEHPLYLACTRFLCLACNHHLQNQKLLSTLLMDLLHQDYVKSAVFWRFLAHALSFQNWVSVVFMGFPPHTIARRLHLLPLRPLSLHHQPLSDTEAPVSWIWSTPVSTIEVKQHGQILQPLLSHASSTTMRITRPLVPKGVHSWEVRLHPLTPGVSNLVPIPAGFSFGICPTQQHAKHKLGEAAQLLAVGFMPASGTLSYRGRTFSPCAAMSASDVPIWQVVLDFALDDLIFRHLQSQTQISMKSLMPEFTVSSVRGAVATAFYPAVTIPSGAACAYCFENYQWQTSDNPALLSKQAKLSNCLYRAEAEVAVHWPDFTLALPCLNADLIQHDRLAAELAAAIIPLDSPWSLQPQPPLAGSLVSDVVRLEYQPLSPQAPPPALGASHDYVDASRSPHFPLLQQINTRDDTMSVLFEKLRDGLLTGSPASLPSTSHRVQYRFLSQLIASAKLSSFRSGFFAEEENRQLFFALIVGDTHRLFRTSPIVTTATNPITPSNHSGANSSAANHQDQVLSESKSAYELFQPLLNCMKALLTDYLAQRPLESKLALVSSVYHNKILEALLTELAIVTGMRHRNMSYFSSEIDAKLIVGQSANHTASPASQLPSSGGTGYSNHTTSYKNLWNVDQQHEVACIRDSHISSLCTLLNHILELTFQVHGCLDQPILTGMLAILEASCLVPVIASYLRNGAVNEVLKTVGLYASLFKLIESISTIPTFQSLLSASTKSESSLVALLHALVDLFKHFFDSAKRWDNGYQQDDSFSLDITDRSDYEFFLLCSSTLDLIESSQPALMATMAATSTGSVVAPSSSSLPENATELPLESIKSPQEMYEEILRPWQFMERSNILGASCFQSIFSSDGRPSITKCKRLVRELASLQTTLPLFMSSSIFLHVSDQRPDVMQALITGPADTPYSAGCFVFDIYTGHHYPSKPPSVQLLTTGAGTVRFNPNLYNSGYVCLSLLGTWRGTPQETWNPQTSTLLQVLVSIQSLIFIAEPYFNEPGYDSLKNSPSGRAESESYNEHIRLATARWAIVEQLRIPPLGWKPVILNHFKLRSAEVLKQVREWRNMSKNKKPWNSILHDLKEQLNKIEKMPFVLREQ